MKVMNIFNFFEFLIVLIMSFVFILLGAPPLIHEDLILLHKSRYVVLKLLQSHLLKDPPTPSKNIMRRAAITAPIDPSMSLITCKYAPRIFKFLLHRPRSIIQATIILINKPTKAIINMPVEATSGVLNLSIAS